MDDSKFTPSIIEKIGYYVYVLVNPETNRPFYIGKGKGNRIFQSGVNDGLKTIEELSAKGLSPKHIIMRHGLTEKEAFEVEAALIDWIGLENLDNRVLGYKADERGRMTVREIFAEYDAPKIRIAEPSILIIVNKKYYRGIGDEELYEITRQHWLVAPDRHEAEYAFAVYNGIVRQVYEIERWLHSNAVRGRWMFDGKVADNLKHYVGGSVARYITQGAQNPIKYVNC